MSRYQGGMIGSVANATSGTAYTGRANGVFPLPQQIVAKSSSLWAIGQTRPNPPTIGTATGTGATTISVAFIPPVQNGGSAITSYTVTSSGGQTATGSSSPIVVSGLTNGVSYTFTVTATNALGTSDSSGTSNSTQPAIPDPYFSSVSLLLNGDTLTDLSSSPKTITNNGAVSVNTSTKKFGTGSIQFSGNNYLTFPVSTAFQFGTGNFTVECWIYQQTPYAAWPFILDFGEHISGPGFGWVVGGGAGSDSPTPNNMSFFSQGWFLSGLDVSAANTWIHIAAVRANGLLYFFVNGVMSSGIAYTKDLTLSTSNIGVGACINGPYALQTNRNFKGYIDDLRITKGVARYTTNFTPPTAALPTF